MAVYENPNRMWFGTERKMQWIETPQTGADVSTVGMSASEVLLNGGAWARNSIAGHKRYTFSWGDSLDTRTAGIIQSYSRGTFGKGPIYFLDPMWADKNILPQWMADPSMAANYEGPTLVAGTVPSLTPTANNANDLPVDTANYTVPGNYDPQMYGTEVTIPIPPGEQISLGFVGTASSTAQVRVRRGGVSVNLTPLSVSSTTVTNITLPDTGSGFLHVGLVNPAPTPASISIVGMVARINSDPAGPWLAGEGNSGCRFEGKPTLVNYGGLFGGQVGVAATLVETGAWE